MKTKSILLSLLAITSGICVFAQENDDMYFNSKDRVKLRAQQQKEQAYASNSDYNGGYANNSSTSNTSPDLSYSGRNLNPEYASRQNSQTAQTDNQNYYDANYRYSTSTSPYNTASNYNNWNNSYNSWYNNPWYNSSWYGPSMGACSSAYYGG